MSVRDWYYALFIYRGHVYVGEIDKYALRDGIYILESWYCPDAPKQEQVNDFREKWTGIVNAGVPAGYFAVSGIPTYHDD